MEIIILKISPYKEKDGIVDAISEEGHMSFLLRGVFDPKNKNAALNNPLTIAEVELAESKYKYPIIKSSMVLVNPINLHYDLSYMAVIMMITEATLVMLNEEEKPLIYQRLTNTIKELKEGISPLKIAVSYISRILQISGYDFQVNECVKCGSKKNIATFSFNDGGFICSNCYTPDVPILFNKNQMLAIRESFNSEDTHLSNDEITDEEIIFLLHKFFEFIYDSFNYKMKSADLFK